ncbi:RNA-splicing factor [Coemansia sp. RSA 989]|nr:ring finger protein-like protein 113A [Coemansia mojavensis]KAJ1863833.1 RNA-splicing factor [Coemansia sp. RSA 989]KAJ1874363.1 RNA-splicing factor [Coemansia sp. RSA 990]
MANSELEPLFKKSRRRGGNIRKRQKEDTEVEPTSLSQDEEAEEAVCSRRKTKQPKTIQSSTSKQETAADTQSASEKTAGTVKYHYKHTIDATRTEEDASKPNASDSKQPQDGDGLYKGKHGYINRAAGTGSMRAGPVRGPANVRTTNVVDYQPNVCKDYKETGYCGYGDSCIFLHDRGTYKTGWQLEKEFEESQQGIKRDNPRLWQIPNSDDEDDARSKKAGEELPFACLICRKPFSNPVVTKCQHYFCEACALARYRKSPKCFACGAPTGGVFKKAKNLVEP